MGIPILTDDAHRAAFGVVRAPIIVIVGVPVVVIAVPVAVTVMPMIMVVVLVLMPLAVLRPPAVRRSPVRRIGQGRIADEENRHEKECGKTKRMCLHSVALRSSVRGLSAHARIG
jgi:hypothetical protein